MPLKSFRLSLVAGEKIESAELMRMDPPGDLVDACFGWLTLVFLSVLTIYTTGLACQTCSPRSLLNVHARRASMWPMVAAVPVLWFEDDALSDLI